MYELEIIIDGKVVASFDYNNMRNAMKFMEEVLKHCVNEEPAVTIRRKEGCRE